MDEGSEWGFSGISVSGASSVKFMTPAKTKR